MLRMVKCSERFTRITHLCVRTHTHAHTLINGLKVFLANLQNHFLGCQEMLGLSQGLNFTLQWIHAGFASCIKRVQWMMVTKVKLAGASGESQRGSPCQREGVFEWGCVANPEQVLLCSMCTPHQALFSL